MPYHPGAAESSWLLLRGLARERRHWGDFPARFGFAVGARELHCLDLPGSGAKHASPAPASVPEIVAALREEVGRLGLRRPFYVLGLSLGGMVALEWLNRHPGDIDGAVLINTSLGGLCPWYRRLRPSAYPLMLRGLLSDPLAREYRVLELTSRLRGGSHELARRWAQYAREQPMSPANFLRQIAAAARFRGRPLLKLDTPGLLLYSQHDALVHPSCSQRLARYLDWPCRGHPWAGHDLPLDAPEWVINEAANWFARIQMRGAGRRAS